MGLVGWGWPWNLGHSSLKYAPLLRSLNPTHWPNCPLTNCYGNVGRGWNTHFSQDMKASKMFIDSDQQDCCESGDQTERHENTRTLRLGVQDATWPLWSHLTFEFYRCIRIASYNLQIWRWLPSTEIAIDRQLLYPWAFQRWRTFGSTRFCGRSDVKGGVSGSNSGWNAPYFQFLYCLRLEFSGCSPRFAKCRFPLFLTSAPRFVSSMARSVSMRPISWTLNLARRHLGLTRQRNMNYYKFISN